MQNINSNIEMMLYILFFSFVESLNLHIIYVVCFDSFFRKRILSLVKTFDFKSLLLFVLY
jgi:hypothetical protein